MSYKIKILNCKENFNCNYCDKQIVHICMYNEHIKTNHISRKKYIITHYISYKYSINTNLLIKLTPKIKPTKITKKLIKTKK